jgi:hypothetical protein
MEFVRTADMITDGLTKLLQGLHFERFVKLMRLSD